MSGSNGDTGRSGRMTGLVQRMAAPLSTAIQFALVASLSFSLALYLAFILPDSSDTAMIGAMWAMISAIIVTQETRSATISMGGLRVIGSFIGAVFSAVYLLFFPFSIAGMGVLIGIVVLTCILLGMPGYLRLAALTAGIVLVISAQNPEIPPFVNAAHRFLEVIVGSSVAIAAAWIWQYMFRSS